MKIVKFCVMTGLAFGLPFAATAQQNVAKGTPSDIKYCDALGRAYARMFPVQEGMTAADVTAIGQCNADTQEDDSHAREEDEGPEVWNCRRTRVSRSRLVQPAIRSSGNVPLGTSDA